MRCPNTRRTIRSGQEEIQAKDKVQSSRVLDFQVEIHRPHRETPKINEGTSTMTYQLAQSVRRSIGESVVRKQGKLKTIRRSIGHKELECQRQP